MSDISSDLDILVVGSGPAGYTAAIYGARAGRSVKVVTGEQPGGQLTITSSIENYPGFEDIISGPELMEKMRQQAEKNGAEICCDTIETVDFSGRQFICKGEKEYLSKAVIIATGARARWIGVPGELEYRGRGVSACATCDGFFFRNKEVAVIGGGNTAVEEALYLTNFAKKVTLIHRRDSLRAEKIMQERLLKNEKINVIWNTRVEGIFGDENCVSGLKLIDNSGKESDFHVDGIFVAVGHQPATEIFKDSLKIDDFGYIEVSEGVKTSVPGVFAAGDVCDPHYRQAVVSAAMGCMAAIQADKFLSIEK